MYTQNTTSTAKVQAPTQMTPSNCSLSMIEWAQHQQRERRQVDNNTGKRLFLWTVGLGDVQPSEVFA